MRERPILFSGLMVRAILAGQKTQTRRVVREQREISGLWFGHGCSWSAAAHPAGLLQVCPYGQPGDRLWVRETWKLEQYGGTRRPELLYRADMDDESAARWAPWRPSIFMKRGASRLTLEVTEVRVQRLQEISAENARAEGVQAAPFCKSGRPNGLEHVEAFEDLWQTINGARPGCSWDANPWVWAITFKRVEGREP